VIWYFADIQAISELMGLQGLDYSVESPSIEP
jgi:hypothetical protein